MFKNRNSYKDAAKVLKAGGACVLPTDTIYGIHCQALNKESVERVYSIKSRDRSKPFIILIPSIKALKEFGITFNEKELKRYWPGPISIKFPSDNNGFEYLHCGKGSLAFRLPKKKSLIKLMKQVGPLISTSVNKEGEPSISSVVEAQQKFDGQIDLYVDEGPLDNKPSKLIDLQNTVYRE
ncbi:MAG: L-threonylcarbamoyladenylate synthase [Patescibacteria group bacterium]|jgi:L-threonylcarbamoyladenylate synthase